MSERAGERPLLCFALARVRENVWLQHFTIFYNDILLLSLV